jgi:signal peptidase I
MSWGIHRGHLIIYVTVLIAIAVGWTTHSIYIDFSDKYEKVAEIPERSTMERIADALTIGAAEIISPDDHIREDQIIVTNEQVILLIEDAIWSSFTDTNSMDPLLDYGSNGIEIVPESVEDITVGDVISYRSTTGGIVIHRVIDIASDEEGIYYIMKGDNNPTADAQKVRFEDVQGILVAVVY